MPHAIRPMAFADYEAVHRLCRESEGVTIGDDDDPDRFALYLQRNKGLCFVAVSKTAILGAVLCGHDGRRGILRHLAVKRAYRKKGVARALIARCLTALSEQGIRKCNLFVEDTNPEGMRFWEHLGWRPLEDNFRTLQILTEPTLKNPRQGRL